MSLVALCGCGLHPTNNDAGGAINLERDGDWLLVARGESGLDVVDLRVGAARNVAPHGEADSVDDVSADGGILVALDADDGILVSYRIETDGSLVVLDDGIAVDVGPYSGVSMSAGTAIVSGGTCELSLVNVSARGDLALRQMVDGWRGKPDVTLVPGAGAALVSTHFSGDEAEFVDGQEFGVSTLSLRSGRYVDARGIAGAGFSEGGGTPASWPVRARAARDLAFVAHGGGLDVLRVDADLSILPVGRVALDGAGVDVDVDLDAGLAFVLTAVPTAIAVVDVAEPSRPRVVDRLGVPGDVETATAIVVTAEVVYVAAAVEGLLTIAR